MGRTIPSFRPALENEIKSWEDFRRGLKPDEKIIFDNLMNYARIHADAGSLAARPIVTEIIFMTILIEQQKLIDKLREDIEKIREAYRSINKA
ncbi:MAG: hypothetical protein ACTSRZ_03540 [Promethearchaeota archaeon]